MAGMLRMVRTWTGRQRLEDLFRTAEIVFVRGGLTISHHQVIADEIGRAVEEFMCYAPSAFEEVSATTWVRKTFEVEAVIGQPKICIAGYRLRGRGRLAGTFNGVPFTRHARCNNRWYGDWLIFPAPAPVRRDVNELVLRATGSLAWRLFIEPSALPNRSARSVDAGRNWDDAHLGLGSFIDGEYVIRLSGRRTRGDGLVTCPPQQIHPDGCGVAPAGRVKAISVSTRPRLPVEVRLGAGPWLAQPGQPATWTAWRKSSPSALRAMERELGPPGPRFVQWRARLSMQGRPAPVLKSVKLVVELAPTVDCPSTAVRVDAPRTVLPGRPFAHQGKSEHLTAVRRRLGLDRIYQRGRNEWEGLLNLAAWVGHYCSHRMPASFLRGARYDLVEILELGHARKLRVLCGQLAFAFVQLACALGHTGRVLLRGNHLVTEVWSPTHRKWAVIDPMDRVLDHKSGKRVWTPGYGGYYHRGDDRPMSAIELGAARGRVRRRHLVWKTGRYASRPATGERDLRWFRREISYPQRNNHTDAYDPVFYADVFRFAGHLKFRRGDEQVMPYYWNFTSRRGDLEWTVGETAAFVTAMGPGRFLVQLDSRLPNTTRFRITGPPAADRSCQGNTCLWRPGRPGHELVVRAINAFGLEGPATVCRLLSK